MRRSKSERATGAGKVLGSTEGELARIPDDRWTRLARRADLIRSAGAGPLSRAHARSLANRLNVHWTTIYRWRNSLDRHGLASEQAAPSRRPQSGFSRLTIDQERLVADVIETGVRHRGSTRIVDLVAEVARRCAQAKLAPPTRRAITLRWHRALEMHAADRAPPGSYVVERPLDVVQIDHTVSDVIVVDNHYRAPIGRPYLTVALDVATRAILAAMLSFDAPSAVTVALCLTRIASPKDEWIAKLGLDCEWPMWGLPKSIHLDNAPEFHSKALTRGCAQFGIEIIYRPPGRPHFGGHVERSIGTLMSRFKTLPGATGSSTIGRKARKAEERATLTLDELERWLVMEIADGYHHHPHRGLQDVTPYAAWKAAAPPPPSPERLKALSWVFLPACERTVRREGIFLNNIRYWHPIFSQWAVSGKIVVVHFDPRDLSRLYLRTDDRTMLEVCYADLTRPAISLWECRAAAKHLRDAGANAVRESRLFAAVEEQRAMVRNAAAKTRAARAKQARLPKVPEPNAARPDASLSGSNAPALDDDQGYPCEVW